MRRWWAGTGWTEEKEQAFQDRWALRIRTCPRKRCRRERGCFGLRGSRCPGLKTYPFSDAETNERVRFLRAVIKNRFYEEDEGTRPSEEELAVKSERTRKMQELAFKRAKEELGRKN